MNDENNNCLQDSSDYISFVNPLRIHSSPKGKRIKDLALGSLKKEIMQDSIL